MDDLREILRNVWGYDSFRPLQAEAMQSVVAERDSVVVMPTGGGKSLCFQAPALLMPGLAVVVSPLISLMKDQVDALTDNGVAAACVNSTMAAEERRGVADEVRSGRLKLLYLSPERLMTERMLHFLANTPLSFFAIDEAHCISDWGHDFRPEYRMLRELKEVFPRTAIHAYTATATEHVRGDIARELRLENPEILVGSFDRPNLIYRVRQRNNLLAQIREVIDRHRDDSGIIYCIRRADVDGLCMQLNSLGYSALPYHAGMSDADRKANQEAFINDRANIIVATVAFGMGIDKSDVRYVVHAAAPKSLEAYQQESGRAGRDGLEAECHLFNSAGDFGTWRQLQSNLEGRAHEIAMTVLAGIENFCNGVRCRHRSIVEYFGQEASHENCRACDVCLGELNVVADPLVVAQKILSCVLRVRESFGAQYVAQVLTGSRDQRILDRQHDQLSTWGLLKEFDLKTVRNWIDQLMGQRLLERVRVRSGDYEVLQVTEEGRRVLKGEFTPQLLQPERKSAAAQSEARAKVVQASWEGVDRGLFDALRKLRREKADERGIPPFIVFGDATLRGLARFRPSNLATFRTIHGVGEKKCAEYGQEFVDAIRAYCETNELATDVDLDPSASPAARGLAANSANAALIPEAHISSSSVLGGAKLQAVERLRQGESIEEVCHATQRARSTVIGYLVELIEVEGICDPSAWIDEALCERIVQASETVGRDRLKPIHDALEGQAEYDEIRIALACLRNAAPRPQ